MVILVYRNTDLFCFVFNEVSESHDREKTSCVGNHLPDILDLKGKIYIQLLVHMQRKKELKGQGNVVLYIVAKDCIAYEPSICF